MDWLSFIREQIRAQVYEISLHADDERLAEHLTMVEIGGRNTLGHLVLITVYVPAMPKWRDVRTRNR
jgi:hypothetical protein